MKRHERYDNPNIGIALPILVTSGCSAGCSTRLSKMDCTALSAQCSGTFTLSCCVESLRSCASQSTWAQGSKLCRDSTGDNALRIGYDQFKLCGLSGRLQNVSLELFTLACIWDIDFQAVQHKVCKALKISKQI